MSGATEQCGLCLSCGAPFVARMDAIEAMGFDRGYMSLLWLNGKARTSMSMQTLFRTPRLFNVPQRAHIFHQSHHSVALDYMMNRQRRDSSVGEPANGAVFPRDSLPLAYIEDPAGQNKRGQLAFWAMPPRDERILYTALRDFLVSAANRHRLGDRLGHGFPVDELATTYDTCADCNGVMTQRKRFMDLLARGSTALIRDPDSIGVRNVDTHRHNRQADAYNHWTRSGARQQNPRTLTPLVAYYLHLCLPFPPAGGDDFFRASVRRSPDTQRVTRSLYIQQAWLILEIACLCGTLARSRQEGEQLACGYKTYLGSLDLYTSFFCWRLFQFQHLGRFDPALDFVQWHQKYFACAAQCKELRLSRRLTIGEFIDPGDLQQGELVVAVHDHLMHLYSVIFKPLCGFLSGQAVSPYLGLYFIQPRRLGELVDRSRECGHAEFGGALARFGVKALMHRMIDLCRSYPDDIKEHLRDFVSCWERIESRNTKESHPSVTASTALIWHQFAQLVVRPRRMPATREELLRFIKGDKCSPWASVLTLASMGALRRRRAPVGDRDPG